MRTKKKLFKDCPVFDELDSSKNDIEKLKILPYDSSNKVWWICRKGHQWETTVYKRASSNPTGCPFCGGKICITGYNDLATHHPHIADEWHPTKNEELTPSNITKTSNKKVWWLCAKGHSWEAKVSHRTTIGHNCRICRNTKAGNISELFPHLNDIWDFNKNENLQPMHVAKHSKKLYWWICPEGHSVQSLVRNVIKGINCDTCEKNSPEFISLLNLLNNEKNNFTDIKDLTFNDEMLFWICENNHEWTRTFKAQKKVGSFCARCVRSIAFLEPSLAKLFHPFKNGNITVYDVPLYDFGGVWWKCLNNHEWYSTFETIKKKNGCIICGTHREKKYLTSFFLETNGSSDFTPIILREQIKNNKTQLLHEHVLFNEVDLEMNNDLDIFNISINSNIRLWWKCKNSHSWIQSVDYRIRKSSTCKKCNSSILRKTPELAKQWDAIKNAPLTPDNFFPADSKKIIWFVCENNHEWFLSFNKKFLYDKVCNFCKIIDNGDNLSSKNPILAKEWHPHKNFPLTTDLVHIGSIQSVWWLCAKGHEWKSSIKNRNTYNSGCKICLATINGSVLSNSILAKEWNYTKNTTLLPQDLPLSSSKIVWWKCDQGHDWKGVIRQRVFYNSSCTACSKSGTSKIESKIRESLKIHMPDIFSNPASLEIKWRNRKSMTVDIFSKKNNLVVEYDGAYFHNGGSSNKSESHHLEVDTEKTLRLLEQGYIVVRIREKGLPFLNITHPNLLQIPYNFGATYGYRYGEGIEHTIESIIEWLTEPYRK